MVHSHIRPLAPPAPDVPCPRTVGIGLEGVGPACRRPIVPIPLSLVPELHLGLAPEGLASFYSPTPRGSLLFQQEPRIKHS
jgi:hypothetical protein